MTPFRNALWFAAVLGTVESAVVTAILLSWSSLTPAQRSIPEWEIVLSIPVAIVVGLLFGLFVIKDTM